jgi:hypothetical protein
VHQDGWRAQHAQLPTQRLGGLAGQRLGFLHAHQDGAHRVGLQLGHPPRHHGRHHVQRAGGLGEAAFVHHAGKDIHRTRSIQGRFLVLSCVPCPRA